MTRPVRNLLWIVGSLALLPVIVFLVLTTSADHTPILGSSIAEMTARELNKRAEPFLKSHQDSGPLLAGWSRFNITPPLGAPTYGYSARYGKGITAVADSAYVRALALSVAGGSTVVFLSADICTWVPSVADSITSVVAKALPGTFLYFGATHTHNGPGGYSNGPVDSWIMGGDRNDLRNVLVSNSARAIEKAVSSLAPSRQRSFETDFPDLIFNRTGKPEAVDDDVLLLETRKETGETCALVVFGAHATTVTRDSLVCSADYPGFLTRTLTDSGYAEVVFFAGATGQSGPSHDGKTISGGTMDRAALYGQTLATRLLSLVRHSEIPFDSIPVLRAFSGPVYLPEYQYQFLSRVLEHPVAGCLFGDGSPEASVRCVQLGKNLFVGHSFEFSGVLSEVIDREINGPGRKIWITGFNGRNYLYVVPDTYYSERAYESSMSLFGPGLGEYLKRITIQLAVMMFSREESSSKPFDLSQ